MRPRFSPEKMADRTARISARFSKRNDCFIGACGSGLGLRIFMVVATFFVTFVNATVEQHSNSHS